jgi:hypothetical protein
MDISNKILNSIITKSKIDIYLDQVDNMTLEEIIQVYCLWCIDSNLVVTYVPNGNSYTKISLKLYFLNEAGTYTDKYKLINCLIGNFMDSVSFSKKTENELVELINRYQIANTETCKRLITCLTNTTEIANPIEKVLVNMLSPNVKSSRK